MINKHQRSLKAGYMVHRNSAPFFKKGVQMQRGDASGHKASRTWKGQERHLPPAAEKCWQNAMVLPTPS